MARVRSRDTAPELAVRRALWAAGFRHRLGGMGLPGRPDLVWPGRRIALFVHGCFWHGHDCRRGARVPRANHAYWVGKIAANRARDAAALDALAAAGWTTVVAWECDLAGGLAQARAALRGPG
jgi:DNA mismatch endonuclease (patch repair protein)